MLYYVKSGIEKLDALRGSPGGRAQGEHMPALLPLFVAGLHLPRSQNLGNQMRL